MAPLVTELDASVGHGKALDERRPLSGSARMCPPIGLTGGIAQQMQSRALKLEMTDSQRMKGCLPLKTHRNGGELRGHARRHPGWIADRHLTCRDARTQ